jgi:hypothetical protein
METAVKLLIAASLSALSLAACASTPKPREANGAYAEGYTERALSANRYLISYRMDGADYQRAYDLALWRAAQLSLENGYPAFEVVSRESDTDPGVRPATTFATERSVTYHRSCGLVSCTTHATPTWNRVAVRSDGRRPSRVVALEVTLTSESAGNSPNHYDAASVIGNAKDQ